MHTPVTTRDRYQLRHPQYYLEGGDVVFRVEDTLFRLHSYFFLRESPWFRQKLPHPGSPGQKVKGCSDDAPFVLDDAFSDDFARFIWVFYNPKYSFRGVTVEDWVSILKLAHQWGFDEVKALCIRELEELEINPVRKIVIYHKYELPEHLLMPSYTTLCTRVEPLSVEEGKALGLETSLQIATGRENARGQLSGGGLRSPGPVTLMGGELYGLIKEVFNVDTSNAGIGDIQPRKAEATTVTLGTPQQPQANGSSQTVTTSDADTASGTKKNGKNGGAAGSSNKNGKGKS
ncbi:hypothetical protein DENSPDRAFT_699324 [Dentipellis sp. KUC8613]|nr:hypothetical protein DENSPDRAFT_699324 [Dentipellis sp. KUC8613]